MRSCASGSRRAPFIGGSPRRKPPLSTPWRSVSSQQSRLIRSSTLGSVRYTPQGASLRTLVGGLNGAWRGEEAGGNDSDPLPCPLEEGTPGRSLGGTPDGLDTPPVWL